MRLRSPSIIVTLVAFFFFGCASEPPRQAVVDSVAARPEAARPFPQTGRPPPTDFVVLLPGADGKTGAVFVRKGKQETVLGSAYARAQAARDRAIETGESAETAVKKEFAEAFTATPPAPLTFTAYFRFGRDELTEESRKEITPRLDEMARRPAPEIALVGHADLRGPDRVNDALSMKRAERIRQMLTERGVAADRIAAEGRGSHEPVVQTRDGVSEPRNRRVEISVR